MAAARARSRSAVIASSGIFLALAGFAFSLQAPAITDQVINPVVQSFIDSHENQPIPVIVQAKGSSRSVEQMVRDQGGTVSSDYRSINGFAARVSPETARSLNRDPRVEKLNIDAPVRFNGSAVVSSYLLNRYDKVDGLGANVWNKYDGSNVQVALLDSGVYPHDDLIKANPSIVPANTGNRLLALTTNAAATDAIDHVGHGTHVAGILGGNGYDSRGQYVGVAPNSLVVSVKVSDDAGNVTEGDVINGMEWVYQANQHGLNIRVVNLSMSSTVATGYNYSALDAMAEKLWASGVTVVASSGVGAGGLVNPPGNDPYVITVGSIDDNYQPSLAQAVMASWSPYGTTQDGFQKPELVADGSHVVSLAAPGSLLSGAHPDNVIAGNYFKMGGTSMAAPQVAGMVALMLQANPGMSNNRVKQVLMDRSSNFSNVSYTSWLGKTGRGSFVVGNAVGQACCSDANGGLSYSYSFNLEHMAIVQNGTVLIDAAYPDASWNNTSWNNTSWNNTSWNGTQLNNTSWNSMSWVNTSWNNTSWNNTSWNNTSWNNTSWNNTSWNNTSWNNTSWNNTSWNNTSWNNTSWNDTSWNEADFS